MKRSLILFLFLIYTLGAYAQFEELDRQQLLGSLRYADQDTNRLRTYIALADSYENLPAKSLTDSALFFLNRSRELNRQLRNRHYQNQIDLVVVKIRYDHNPELDLSALFKPVIETSSATGDRRNQLDALLTLMERMTDKQRPDLSYRSYFPQALSLSRQLNDRRAQLNLYRFLAEVHLKQHELDSAEKELLHISRDRAASREQLLIAYDRLSGLYTTKGKYDQALKYALATQRYIRTALDTNNLLATSCGRLRLIYSLLGNYAESNIWARKAFDHCFKNGQYEVLALIRGSIASNLIAEGKPASALAFVLAHEYKKELTGKPKSAILFQRQVGDCYYALKDYVHAESSYRKLYQLMNDHPEVISVYDAAVYNFVIGKFYVSTGREALARRFLETALANYRATGFVSFIKDSYLLLFKVDSAAGNFRRAIGYLQESNRLKDSIYSAEKSKQIAELQIAYQTEQKNKNIQQLRNSAKYQALRLRHTETTRTWIISGLVLVLVIAGLLYRQARSARRNHLTAAHKNEVLQQLIQEKEWLLKEVHHRVKNNLHTVISLLESQARYLKDDALRAIESTQYRIYAMSLLHQKLYKSQEIKSIAMSEYIAELIVNLRDSFGVTGRVDFEVKVEDIALDVAYAIPVGLIINEAVTNSIKYAFPSQPHGKITISLSRYNASLILGMTDDGVGIPEHIVEDHGGTLGIELMKGLCDDINGQINFTNSMGTSIVLFFTPVML